MAEIVLMDVEDAMKRLGGSKKLYVRLLGKFDGNADLEKLNVALLSGDSQAAQAQAHTIKGLAGNLSLKDLQAKALELEQKLKNGEDPKGLDNSEIIKSTADTVQAVKDWLAQNA